MIFSDGLFPSSADSRRVGVSYKESMRTKY